MELSSAVASILKSRGVSGKVVFAMLGGSHAYNLSRTTSDKDIFAVYSASPENFWGLRMPAENLNAKVKLGDIDTDVNIMEIGKFCSLLISGNPTIIEALYATHNSESSDTWENLKQHRKVFLSNDLVKQYISFAAGQVAQIKAKPQNNKKKIYQATRLLIEARRLIQGNEPRVWLEGEDQEYLMEVRNEKYELEDLLKKCQENIDQLQSLKPWPLLAKVDEEFVNLWLKDHRKAEHSL